MSHPLLPLLVERVSAGLIFSLAIFMVVVQSAVVARVAPKTPLSPRGRSLAPFVVGGYLAVWLGLALTIGNAAVMSEPTIDRLLIALVVGFGPVLLALSLLVSSKALRALNASTPPAWLIWVQSYRMVGLIFLYPFFFYGLVPAGFAIPAALGDFLTGLLAPWVGRAVAQGRPGARGWAIGWNLFGILDLIVAPIAAFLSHSQVLGMYPLVLVPLFLGPPLGILTHLLSLRTLSASGRVPVTGAVAAAV